MSKESKLVEALKVFMDKAVIPTLDQEHPSLNQWKYLKGILSSDPIDPSQIDFYLLMANKSNADSKSRTSSIASKPVQKYNIGPQKLGTLAGGDSSNHSYRERATSGDSRRKLLLTNMQNFQSMMTRHQEKLENFNKKDGNTSSYNISGNISNTSYTMGSKKII